VNRRHRLPYSIISSARAINEAGTAAKSLGSLEIDYKLELGGLLDRQVGWFCAVDDLSGINAGLAYGSCEARAIAE
jgi:hypothetical protein